MKKFASDAVVEVGQKLHPRRYRRFKDLRPREQVGEWVKTLDWRSNPYDRFLLRREILHHLESTVVYQTHKNVFAFAPRSEIEDEVDRLIEVYAQQMDNHAGHPKAYPQDRVFGWVLGGLPLVLATKHGNVPLGEDFLTEFKLATKIGQEAIVTPNNPVAANPAAAAATDARAESRGVAGPGS